MPAGLPGATLAQNLANPTQGCDVNMDPVSGPKGSPLDAKVITGWTAVAPSGAGGMPTTAANTTESGLSTGALSTGIGFGLGVDVPGGLDGVLVTANDLDVTGNFSTQCIPGTTLPSNAAATDARLLYIGGGKSDALGVATPRAVSQLCGAGGGASRDAGGGAGFGEKLVVATGSVAYGAAIVAGFINRMNQVNDFTGEAAGLALATAQAQFGSAAVAAPIPT